MTKALEKPQRLEELGDMRNFLWQRKREIEAILPKFFPVEKMLKLILTETKKNPELLDCTPQSFMGAMLVCAQYGLELGTGQAYIIPYNKSINEGTKSSPKWEKIKEAQFQLGYRGMIELAYRTGKIVKIEAHCAFAEDFLDFEYGTDAFLKHKPARENRGELICAYSLAKFSSAGNEVIFDVMWKEEIDTIRRAYSSEYSKPWKENFNEMARKTSLRRFFKFLPTSPDLEALLALDDSVGNQDFSSLTGKILPDEEKPKPTQTSQVLQHLKTKTLNEVTNNQSKVEVPVPMDVNLPDDGWVNEYDQTKQI